MWPRIAFLGGIGLLGVAILVSMLDIVRELVSTQSSASLE
jgi:hypothetical protein